MQISIENGKISIRKSRVIVKEGMEISDKVSSILQKLKIQPFNVGLDPVAIYDIKIGKIYAGIKIDSEVSVKELQIAASKALGFAQKIGYYCKETIGYFLGKANAEANAINNKIKGGSQNDKQNI